MGGGTEAFGKGKRKSGKFDGTQNCLDEFLLYKLKN